MDCDGRYPHNQGVEKNRIICGAEKILKLDIE